MPWITIRPTWSATWSNTVSTTPIWLNLSNNITASNTLITWYDDVTPSAYYDLARRRIYICRERTEAENRRLVEEQQRRAEAQRRWAREQAASASRARDLLFSHLTREQRKTFEENNWFIVRGGKTGVRYRVKTGSMAGNVEVLDAHDRVTASLCCHCDGVPLHDHHLAQKLALQYDEERFLRVANRTAYR